MSNMVQIRYLDKCIHLFLLYKHKFQELPGRLGGIEHYVTIWVVDLRPRSDQLCIG